MERISPPKIRTRRERFGPCRMKDRITSGRLASYGLPALIIAAILMQVELALAKGINWDEFYHFSQIHRHLQGRPLQWLQIPFVWLFWWVPSLPGDNVTHIQLIRLLILPFAAVTVGAIVMSARCLASRDEALLCGLLYITGGYVFLHAFALRADMIAACLLTVALAIALCRQIRLRELLLVGALVSLAFLSTIKSVLYAPAFVGVILYRLQTPAHRWIGALTFAAATAAGATLLWIAPQLNDGSFSGILRDVGLLGRASFDRMFLGGLTPQSQWIKGQIIAGPALTIALVATTLSTFTKARPPGVRMLQLFLLLPLLTVAFYRNAFPYHFVFILPPAIIAMAPALGLILARVRALALGVVLLLLATILSFSQDREVLGRQREVLAGIHEIFRSPVAYIDDCGLIGDFPRAVNHYASGWGLQNYRRRGVPTYSLAMKSEPVPLLLADSDLRSTVCFDLLHRGALLPDDTRMIEDNYIHHWGNVFVAGKKFPAGFREDVFDVAVPGIYTVEGGTIFIDGIRLNPGDVVHLSRGTHAVAGEDTQKTALRWGNHLPRPHQRWPDGPLFTIF